MALSQTPHHATAPVSGTALLSIVRADLSDGLGVLWELLLSAAVSAVCSGVLTPRVRSVTAAAHRCYLGHVHRVRTVYEQSGRFQSAVVTLEDVKSRSLSSIRLALERPNSINVVPGLVTGD